MTLHADDLTVSRSDKPLQSLHRDKKILYRNNYRIASKKNDVKTNKKTLVINGLAVT